MLRARPHSKCRSRMICPLNKLVRLPNGETVNEQETETEFAITAASWDAGNISCGELALGLWFRIRAIDPGSIFRLITNDPAAPEDLPSWCRMTGHKLVRASHPEYLIQRMEN